MGNVNVCLERCAQSSACCASYARRATCWRIHWVGACGQQGTRPGPRSNLPPRPALSPSLLSPCPRPEPRTNVLPAPPYTLS